MVVRDGELQSLDFNFENLDFIIYLIILAILGVSNFNLEVLALFFFQKSYSCDIAGAARSAENLEAFRRVWGGTPQRGLMGQQSPREGP